MTHDGFGEAKPLGSAQPALDSHGPQVAAVPGPAPASAPSPATPSAPSLPPPPATTGPAVTPGHDVFSGPTVYKEIPLPPRPDAPQGPDFTLPQPGFPAPLGHTAAAPGDTSRNWMGITSLVLGVIGGSVPGLILGFLGLKAAKEGRANNRGIAIAGIVLNSAILVLAFTIAVIAIMLGGFPGLREQQAVAMSPSYVDITDIEVGDCVLEPEGAGDGIAGFFVVGCNVAHWGQVYYIGELPRGDYPGDEAALTAAEDACYSDEGLKSVSYFVPDDAYGFTIWPDATSWEWDDRTYNCLLANDEKPLTKSYVN